MRRTTGVIFALAMLAFVLGERPAPAVIKALVPLSQTLGFSIIVAAEVESVSPDKPAVTFKLTGTLKGKSPTQSFIVNLTGDNFAKKDKHTEVMLDRLAVGRQLVLFLDLIEDDYAVFGFIEGTWFQVRGATTNGKTVWAFLHCEPYFRRTFKGTTAELQQVLKDCLAGKRKPPEPDEKEPHGYGPVAEKKAPPKKDGQPDQSRGEPRPVGFALGGLFAVIPSFLVVGPLALLSALFPSLFAGFASGLQRWRAFLIVISFNSLFTGAYFACQQLKWLPESALFSPSIIAGIVALSALLGIGWAGRRYRRAAIEDASVTAPPTKPDHFALMLALAGVAAILALLAWFIPLPWAELFKVPTREFTAIGFGLLAALGHSLYRSATQNVEGNSSQPLRLSLPGEAVALAGILVFTAVLLVRDLPQAGANRTVTVEAGDAASSVAVHPALTDATLLHEATDANALFSSLGVSADRLYYGYTFGITNRGGVACVDRTTGQRLWTYTDKNLKTVYSTPTVYDGKLYFGEGLHTDSDCRLICLDANTGTKIWEQKTTSHTEGSPVIVENRLYHSAGDDGIYCRKPDTGDVIWHYQGIEQNLHIDTPVVVAGGKVFAGSGYTTFAVMALDAITGREVWRREVPLRSFGSPVLLGKAVVYGLGTGNLTEDLSSEPDATRPKETQPRGLLIAKNIENGETLWEAELPKSVHTQLAADARAIYAACRDGALYAFDRTTGKRLWKVGLGQEFTAGPVVATVANRAATVAVYVVTRDGMVYCLDPQSGRVFWQRGMPDAVQRSAEVLSSPSMQPLNPEGTRRELLVPGTYTNLTNRQTAPAIVRFVDEIRGE